jgi:myo-inositol-1(or 4)-monophosphatase
MVDTAEPSELLELAIVAARTAGELLRARREALALQRVATIATKTSATDLVTAADRESEATIVELISAARPGDGFLAEEETDRASASGITWVIDPIDGTVNYVYGLPAWAVSIAARDETGVVVGVVYDPQRDEVFTAIRGHGAALNGRPLVVSEPPPIASSLVGTGFAYVAKRRALQAEIVAGILPVVRDIRRAGAASLDLCGVASGRLDAYYEADLKPWDLAAGGLIATEAGARLDLVVGLIDTPTVVLAHPDRFDEFLALLRAHAPRGIATGP